MYRYMYVMQRKFVYLVGIVSKELIVIFSIESQQRAFTTPSCITNIRSFVVFIHTMFVGNRPNHQLAISEDIAVRNVWLLV